MPQLWPKLPDRSCSPLPPTSLSFPIRPSWPTGSICTHTAAPWTVSLIGRTCLRLSCFTADITWLGFGDSLFLWHCIYESVRDSSDLEAAANERPGLHHVQRLNIPHSNVSTIKLALPPRSCCAYTGSILVMPPKEFIIPRPCLRPWYHLSRRHSLFGRQWRLWARTGRVMPCPNKATPP